MDRTCRVHASNKKMHNCSEIYQWLLRHRSVDIIKTDLEELWRWRLNLSGRTYEKSLVNMVMGVWAPLKVRNFSTSEMAISFSRTLIYGIVLMRWTWWGIISVDFGRMNPELISLFMHYRNATRVQQRDRV